LGGVYIFPIVFQKDFSWALVAHTCKPSYSEAEIRRITVRSQLRKIVCKTLSRKYPSQKKGLAEWLKVKALSSTSVLKKKQNKTGF
jgi:hypothetical protein